MRFECTEKNELSNSSGAPVSLRWRVVFFLTANSAPARFLAHFYLSFSRFARALQNARPLSTSPRTQKGKAQTGKVAAAAPLSQRAIVRLLESTHEHKPTTRLPVPRLVMSFLFFFFFNLFTFLCPLQRKSVVSRALVQTSSPPSSTFKTTTNRRSTS